VFEAANGAYSPRAIKGYSSDLRIFISWCVEGNRCWLPADPKTIGEFVDEQVERHCISTIKRRLCAIAFAHRTLNLQVPTDANVVRLAVRRATRKRASRPKQVSGLTHEIRSKIAAACCDTLAALRDAALISVGYDTLC
jgi:site-specific recombinase XerD